MQTDANQRRKWIQRYSEEEYDEACYTAIFFARFEKVKIQGGMRYEKLSKLVVLEEKKERINAEEYCKDILDGEMFDF